MLFVMKQVLSTTIVLFIKTKYKFSRAASNTNETREHKKL